MSKPHALIAGAGIGGLCAALCLARAGFRVSLFEKAKGLDEIGAGLQLSPNASAILHELGVLGRLALFALRPQAIRIRRARDGATLALMPLEGAERRWGAPYLVAHRADLQRALLDGAACESAISLETGVTVTGFTSGANGVSVTIGQRAAVRQAGGDFLIGADGVRSLIAQRLGVAAAKFSGRTAYRALIEADRLPAGAARPEANLWLGRKAHLVDYPLRGGSVINVVAIVEEDLRPAEAEFWSSVGDAEFLERRFSRWDGRARELLRAAEEWRKWPLFDRVPVKSWVWGRAALLGDAAHPMLPFLAQGAAQAIEDAAALARALADAQDIGAGLRAYQDARFARAARVQRESRRQAVIYHLSGPAAFLRDTALQALGGEKLLARYDWLYGARGEQTLPKDAP